MLQVTPHMKIYVATEPLDFRCRMDGTAAACRRVLQRDPYSGAVFVFRSRSGKMVRALVFDGHGLWLVDKRASKGRFGRWIASEAADTTVDPHQLQALLAGGSWTQLAPMDKWRPLENVRAA